MIERKVRGKNGSSSIRSTIIIKFVRVDKHNKFEAIISDITR